MTLRRCRLECQNCKLVAFRLLPEDYLPQCRRCRSLEVDLWRVE